MAAWQILAQVGVVLIVMLMAFFLLVRPQLRRIDESAVFLASLNVGDQVLTRGGLIGTVVTFDDFDVVRLALTPSMTVAVDRYSIERRFSAGPKLSERS